MRNSSRGRERKPSEDGYILIAAICLVFLLALSLSIAAPIVARSIQRDREVETMNRGLQYKRAVQLYYRKFSAYPPTIDALVKTQNIRFLRKRYMDPITGKDDWKPVLFGQNKAPLAMGFFGEALAAGATPISGTGPSGGNVAGTGIGGQNGSTFGSGSIFGSGSGTTTGSGTGGSTFGSSGSGQNPTTGTGSGTTGSTGSGSTTSTGTSGTTTGTSSGSSSITNQTFGGAGVVGFSPASTRQSVLLYKKKDHFNEWEFTYSPLQDQPKITGGNTGSSGLPTSGSGSNSGFFGGSSGSGGSSSTGTGSGTTITQPRQ